MFMRPLPARDLLEAAAVCRNSPGPARGVYLAALALVDHSFTDCATLPLGTRDAAIVGLRRAMFGDRLELSARCPRCDAPLDVAMEAAALLALSPATATLPDVEIAGTRFAVRPADSADLAAIADIPSVEQAREDLALRCLIPRDGADVPPSLTPGEIDAVGAAMAEIDPAGDPFVALDCPACATAWDAPVDIAAVLAGEIEGAADALLDEIDAIARAYHWTEDAILALSQERRRAYLARVQS